MRTGRAPADGAWRMQAGGWPLFVRGMAIFLIPDRVQTRRALVLHGTAQEVFGETVTGLLAPSLGGRRLGPVNGCCVALLCFARCVGDWLEQGCAGLLR